MENQEIKIISLPSNNSFEIIGDTPKTDENTKKFNSYDILPSYNEDDEDIPVLDEDGTELLKVPHNSPSNTYAESYLTKKTQVQILMTELKKKNMRKELKCLERHYDKLVESEKKNILFCEFKSKMVETAKNDKNMNDVLKKLYV